MTQSLPEDLRDYDSLDNMVEQFARDMVTQKDFSFWLQNWHDEETTSAKAEGFQEGVRAMQEAVKNSYAAKYCEVQTSPGADEIRLIEFIDQCADQLNPQGEEK